MKNFSKGDRVVSIPMWKYDYARGTVLKVTKDDYTVVKWDDINGEWHYTPAQTQLLYHENKVEDEEAMWKTWGDK